MGHLWVSHIFILNPHCFLFEVHTKVFVCGGGDELVKLTQMPQLNSGPHSCDVHIKLAPYFIPLSLSLPLFNFSHIPISYISHIPISYISHTYNIWIPSLPLSLFYHFFILFIQNQINNKTPSLYIYSTPTLIPSISIYFSNSNSDGHNKLFRRQRRQ